MRWRGFPQAPGACARPPWRVSVVHRRKRGVTAGGASLGFGAHVHEVQAVTPHIVLLNRGRLVAEGHVRQIRDLIDKHPHRIVLRAADDRALAARLVAFEDVVGVELGRPGGGILVETRAPDAFYGRLADIALEDGTAIDEVYSDDDNLEAVFHDPAR